MLLTRQALQDRVLVPLVHELRDNATWYAAALAPHRGQAQVAFESTLAVPYDNGLAIYSRSCGFCHGAVGNGHGDEAPRLAVRPEDLPQLRITPDKLDDVLRHGVPGSAMPVFDFYLESELRLLKAFLRGKIGLALRVERLANAPGPEAANQARETFQGTCSVCHGKDGRGTLRGRELLPPVPDWTQLTTSPSREYFVISEGYSGTLMRPFRVLSPEVRRGLVSLVHGFYSGGKAATALSVSDTPAAPPPSPALSLPPEQPPYLEAPISWTGG